MRLLVGQLVRDTAYTSGFIKIACKWWAHLENWFSDGNSLRAGHFEFVGEMCMYMCVHTCVEAVCARMHVCAHAKWRGSSIELG